MTLFGVVGPVNTISIQLSRQHFRKIGMPHMIGVFGKAHARRFFLGVR